MAVYMADARVVGGVKRWKLQISGKKHKKKLKNECSIDHKSSYDTSQTSETLEEAVVWWNQTSLVKAHPAQAVKLQVRLGLG